MSPTGITVSGTDTDNTPMDGSSGGTGDSVDTGTTGPAPECELDLDCEDGVCLDGACCAFDAVCADSCCGDGELCLFDACVSPGESCTTADDCAEDEYCELAFGEPGGGMGDPPLPGLVCTQPLPPTGACLRVPDRCDDPEADPDNCVETCEFQPEPGQLDTAVKWQWGLLDAGAYPDHSDVWATPTVARIYDANCDDKIDLNDPPNLVFVSGWANETCCSCGGEAISTCKTGVLRMLDGKTGQEIWTLDHGAPTDVGFAGMSVALGDVTGDGFLEIAAMNGDGYPVLVDRNGTVLSVADQPVPDSSGTFGWGGGLALGDMNGDGSPELAYGASVYGTAGGVLTHLWNGANGSGGGHTQALSYMVDLTGDGNLELQAGNTVYDANGGVVWYRDDLSDGFTAVGDLDEDGAPEVVLVVNQVWVLEGSTGATELGPVPIPGNYVGGPPTVADFDGDGSPEIGVAGGQAYVVYNPNYGTSTLETVWQHDTKDTSSARTGSSVFDFEGDGRAEVVYSDECFLRVLDGQTGGLRFAAPNTTFTATEALIVADVDGDAHAEIVRVSNSANWDCDLPPWSEADPDTGRPAWVPPAGGTYYQGLTVFGDAQNSWVGTRTLWNQHAYHVSNVCDGDDAACEAGETYGALPSNSVDNWDLDWLNNFRQNVQADGIFDAADATVSLAVECKTPVVAHIAVRNAGFAPLPAGVAVDVLVVGDNTPVGSIETTQQLLGGQTEVFTVELPEGQAATTDTFIARITDDGMANFVECRDDNNESNEAEPSCTAG